MRRRLLWAMHSPARFVTALAVGLFAALLLVHAVNGGHKQAGPPPPAPSASPSPTPGPTATTAPSKHPVAAKSTPAPTLSPAATLTPGPVHADPAAVDTAEQFITAWASHKPRAQWWGPVGHLTAGSLQQGLRYTDPRRVDATRITGPPHADLADATGAEIIVPTDAGPFVVTVQRSGPRWLVVALGRG